MHEKVYCVACKTEHSKLQFYQSYSPMHNGYAPWCKTFIKKEIYGKDILNGKVDLEKFKSILQQLDLPFLIDYYEGALNHKSDTVGTYFKNLKLKHNRDKTWKDSIHGYGNDKIVDNIVSSKSPSPKKENIDHLIEKWGNGYEYNEYVRLEQFYRDMKDSYEIEIASHKDYLKKICKVSLKMETAIDNDQIDQFKKLSDAYDKLMHSAKFTAVQRSAADKTGGMNTFSEFYEFIEKEGFIPKFHNSEPMDIVDKTIDNLKQFTRRLILGDPNISTIVEESIKRINNNEEEEEFCMDEDIEMDLVGDENNDEL